MTLKQRLGYYNLRKISRETQISYTIIWNYASSRTQTLSPENHKKLVDFLDRINQ